MKANGYKIGFTAVLTVLFCLAFLAGALHFLPIETVYATIIFQNGFEEGRFNPSPGVWTGNSTLSNAIVEVQSTYKANGVYAEHSKPGDHDNNAEVFKDLGGSYTNLSEQAYVMWQNIPNSSGTALIMTMGQSASAIDYVYLDRNSTGSLGWILLYRNNGGIGTSPYNTLFTSQPAIVNGSWYVVELRHVGSATSGEADVYVNGTKILSKTGLNNTDLTANRIYVGTAGGNLGGPYGNGWCGTGKQIDEYIDEVKADPNYIGYSGGSSSSLTVSLNSPSNGASMSNGTVNLSYTPTLVGDSIYNASLWTNATGLWALTESNSTAEVPNVANAFSYTFSSFGTYLWNVEVYDATAGVFASSNYTVIITSSASAYYSSPISLTVSPSYVVTLTVTPTSVTQYQIATLTATLELNGVPQSGQAIQFYNGDSEIGTNTTDSNGIAILEWNATQIGTLQLEAAYKVLP